tara:strand:+ start:21778 stop:21954 length:177 start_codon:yes stop_codon:yes gene_type:complete
MWKIKFAVTLFTIAITCVVGPYIIWYDYQRGDWFLMVIDATIIWMLADYLRRVFKRQM